MSLNRLWEAQFGSVPPGKKNRKKHGNAVHANYINIMGIRHLIKFRSMFLDTLNEVSLQVSYIHDGFGMKGL